MLADSGVSYFHYGAALVEALILAKVILIGQALGLGRRFEGSRLIVPVMVKSVLFAIFTAVFALVEHLIEGLLHHETWNQIGAGMVSAGQSVILARTVMVVVTLVAFFAFWEANRVLGDQKLFDLFFRKRSA